MTETVTPPEDAALPTVAILASSCPKCGSSDVGDFACRSCGLLNPGDPDALNWQPVGREPDWA